MKRIVVFLSGSGSNFISIYNSIIENKVNARIELVISNTSKAKGLSFAQNHGIDIAVLESYKVNYNGKKKIDDEIFSYLNRINPDLIVLAGFLKKIPSNVVNKFSRKIINIHPSILPSFGGKGFYGMKVHNAVIDSKAKITGATVHFVDSDYDTGPIVAQECIMVEKNDDAKSIAQKVLKVEHRIFPFVVNAICNDLLEWDKDRPIILGDK